MENEISIPASLIDRYEILTPFDEEASVFLVRDRLTKELAVEKIKPVHNPALYHQLKEHSIKGVPRIYSIDTVNGKTVLIEEYIHGLNLLQIVLNNGPIPESRVLVYMIQLCDILDQFHKMSPPFIHRDIKPGNIILDSHSDIYLIDFNISREYRADASLDTVAMVSHHFSAPESYGFGQTDPRSDIYSIGATMHYLLTGGYLRETVYDGPLKNIIDKCTMMDPESRYQSAEELRKVLEEETRLPDDDNRGSRWRSFLPPGFRAGKPASMIVAAISYFLIGLMCFSMDIKSQIKGPLSAVDLWLERTAVFIFFIGSILFIFDYRGWLEMVPGIGKINSRIIKTVLCIFILFSVLMGLLVLFISAMTSL